MRFAAGRALIRCGGGRFGQRDLESLGEEPPERNYRLAVVIRCRFESTPGIGQVHVHAFARYIHDIDDVLTRLTADINQIKDRLLLDSQAGNDIVQREGRLYGSGSGRVMSRADCGGLKIWPGRSAIAEVSGVSIGTVMSRLARARGRLIAAMTALGYGVLQTAAGSSVT